MGILGWIIWLSPFIILGPAFFTSKIKGHVYGRYGVYFAVLFFAFLLDLQAVSFRNDYIDFIISQLVLFVLADFFWRGVQNKKRFLRISSVIVSLLLFGSTYYQKVLSGPNSVGRYYDSMQIVVSKAPQKGFFVKKRGAVDFRLRGRVLMELYKKRAWGLLEQKLNTYLLNEGYEQADFSFRWHFFNSHIAVDVIGNSDTLWTLTDPGPPK